MDVIEVNNAVKISVVDRFTHYHSIDMTDILYIKEHVADIQSITLYFSSYSLNIRIIIFCFVELLTYLSIYSVIHKSTYEYLFFICLHKSYMLLSLCNNSSDKIRVADEFFTLRNVNKTKFRFNILPNFHPIVTSAQFIELMSKSNVTANDLLFLINV